MTIGKRFLKLFFAALAFVCLPVLAGPAGPAARAAAPVPTPPAPTTST